MFISICRPTINCQCPSAHVKFLPAGSPSPTDRPDGEECLSLLIRQIFLASAATLLKTRSSADADKPARPVKRSVEVTKHSTIPYVRYSFLLCNSNFVFKTHRLSIFDFKKCRDLEIWVRGHSRSLQVVPSDRLRMISY